MKRFFAAAGLAALLAAAAAPTAHAQVAPSAAVADASRPQADKDRDADRKPAELIAFMGVKPGMTIVDVWPGSGYWTRLFSKVVGPKGKVYAYVPAEIAEFKNKPVDVAKATAAEPGLGNVEVFSGPLAAPPPPEMKGKFDVVWVFENYHDFYDPFMKGADVAAFDKAVFDSLKPGGFFVIGDHAAPAGSDLADTNTTHRIDSARVKADLEKAGFRFVGESKALANPADDHTAKVFDPAIKGKTDRFVYKFMKPKK